MDSDSKKPTKFFAKPLAPAELLEAPVWLIKGILPEGFLSLLKGLPGSFKTFEAVAMALCVATGLSFCGQRTKRSNVLYVAADDPDGPQMRAQAWIKHHQTILKDFGIPLACPNAVLFDQAVNLYQESEVATAAEDIMRQNLKPDLIVWDMRLTLGYWPWSLLAQPEPLPEQMITASADAVVDHALQGWGSDRNSVPPDVRNAYIEQLRDLPTVHAICEEYRAAATLDFAQDTEDHNVKRRIACPLLALWGKGGPLDRWYLEAGGPLGIWRNWAKARMARLRRDNARRS